MSMIQSGKDGIPMATWIPGEFAGAQAVFGKLHGLLRVVDGDFNVQRNVMTKTMYVASKLALVELHSKHYETDYRKFEKEVVVEKTLPRMRSGAEKESDEALHVPTLNMHVEAFLSQFKSTLDMLPDLIAAALGGRWRPPQTFGEGGDKVLSYIRKTIGQAHAQALEPLAKYIETQQEWLKKIIKERVDISHYHPLDWPSPIVRTHWDDTKEGAMKADRMEIVKHPTAPGGKGVIEYLAETYGRLEEFCLNVIDLVTAALLQVKEGA